MSLIRIVRGTKPQLGSEPMQAFAVRLRRPGPAEASTSSSGAMLQEVEALAGPAPACGRRRGDYFHTLAAWDQCKRGRA